MTAWLQREAVRHTVASVIALAVAFGLLVLAGVTTADPDVTSRASSAVMSLLFGVYGPVFLVLSYLAFQGADGYQLRSLLARTDERRRAVRMLLLAGPKSWAMLVIVAGLVSVVVLAANDARQSLWLVGICVLGVIGTWVVMVAVFAVEYMRSWAEDDGIAFPGDEERSFRDFVYLAVQMSTTFSSSDVQLVRRSARSLATVHSVVAFAYSTAIIAVFASLLIANA